jgi:hypothetical protein
MGKNTMIKELIIGIGYLIVTTIIVYPVSSVIADTMQMILTENIVNFILINVVRYIGFIIGALTIKWIYNALKQQDQQTYTQIYDR